MNNKRETEINELDRLLGRGIKFTVHRRRIVRHGLFGIRKKTEVEDLEFEIKEPTLAVLDRMSAEGVLMDIDEKAMQSANGISEAKKIIAQHSVRMAKVVAIAVIGEEYETAVIRNGRTHYVKDDRRLNELTSLFAHCIQPSVLVKLCVAINTMSNLGDFISCTRLMSASRTTIPDLVQE